MRKIIHVDMDCFLPPWKCGIIQALRDIPIAIGSNQYSRGDQHGQLSGAQIWHTQRDADRDGPQSFAAFNPATRPL